MPQKQALVIGLGQFGSALARSLVSQNVEVVGVDTRMERVQAAAPYLTDVVCLNATDEAALAGLAPSRRDLCAVSLGENAREGSILVTALLRQMGAPKIISRATDDLHERVLRLVGAHEVVNPERAYGERLATRLAHQGVADIIPLGDGLSLTELIVPASFVGRSLIELTLPKRHGVTVVAIRMKDREGATHLLLPDPRRPLREDDVLLLVSQTGAALSLADRS